MSRRRNGYNYVELRRYQVLGILYLFRNIHVHAPITMYARERVMMAHSSNAH